MSRKNKQGKKKGDKVRTAPGGEHAPAAAGGGSGSETPVPPGGTVLVPVAPAWPMWVNTALMVVAVGVCLYMTQHFEIAKYGGEELQAELWGCAEAEGVSCDAVANSPWAELFGVPLFTWGIPFYLLLTGLSAMVAQGRREFLPLIAVFGLGAAGFSIFLWNYSVVELGNVCLWCKRLYFINFGIVGLSLMAGVHKDFDFERITVPSGQALGAYVLLMVLSVGGQKAFRASLLGDEVVEELKSTAELEKEEVKTGPFVDPQGPAPALSFDITTEDKNQVVLTIEPDDAWKGNPDAKVAVIEFADLECGYCKRAGGQLKRLYEAYGDRVVFVFKHFPMDPKCNPGVNNLRHRRACNAAVASVCAQDQGRFWAFHDLAFKNQHQLKPENLATYAEKVGLDMNTFNQCVRNPNSMARVRADGAAGKGADVHGTPRIFINGRLYRSGNSAEQMARAIEMALGSNAKDAQAAARSVGNERIPVKAVPAGVPDMMEVTYGDQHFFMDTFESGVVEGKAATGKHVVPGTRMSWFAAKDACEASGKRMCSEAEWIAACQGAAPVDDNGNGQFADDLIEGTAYPYSDYHERGRCWDDKDRDAMRPVYTGEMPGCVSKDGIYDLTGNVEEWVGDKPENAVLLGGGFDTSKDHARCFRRNDTFGAGFANKRTGFRCCKTPGS